MATMKLLIDNQAKRVLFAEASKECVDVLFYLLSLPVATVVSLLKKQGNVGSLSNLYKSVENLNESYIQPNQNKDNLLKPFTLDRDRPVPLYLSGKPTEKKFYRCSNQCIKYVTDDPSAVCHNCNSTMTVRMEYLAPPAARRVIFMSSCDEGGFVKGLVKYIVMDSLEVKPMSTISSITLLNKFNVKEVSKLEEKVVNLGMDKAVNLLKASLQSEKVLTDVFLKGKVTTALRN